MIFVGIDWSEQEHEVEVMAESGQRLRSLRITHGVEGLSKLPGMYTYPPPQAGEGKGRPRRASGEGEGLGLVLRRVGICLEGIVERG